MRQWTDFGLSFPDSFSGELQSVCPSCSHTRKKKTVKCLSANGDKLAWVCFHCGWSGTLKEGVDHKSDPFRWSARKYAKPEYRPLTNLPQQIVDWFKGRGISESTLARNKIGHESVYMPQSESYIEAIRFPFYRKGEVINIKSRTMTKDFKLEVNAERIFYGLDDCDGDMAIIVEGEIDKLSMEEAGYRNCISVPDGAPSPNAKDYTSKFSFLENCEDFIGKIKTFILAVDSDAPGQTLEEELARRLGKYKCRRVQWPEGCKDANDVLITHGKDAIEGCILSARDYPVDGIFDISDISAQIDLLYETGAARGEKTGWASMDDYYTVRVGEWTAVTGVPSHGKSEWLDAMMINLARDSAWDFAIFSPENQPLERHAAKLAEKVSEKPFFIGIHDRMTRTELEMAKIFLKLHFTFVLPPEGNTSVDGILGLAEHVVLKKGIKGVVIDPWNEIDHSRPGGMTETEYTSDCLSRVRRFARLHGVHIWLVAHPTKLKKLDDGTYPVPTPYDISGSAHWRNKADNCITVYRHMDSDEVDIHVQKIRFKEIGMIGMVTLKYDKVTGIYKEVY
jgi:twinkle protein